MVTMIVGQELSHAEVAENDVATSAGGLGVGEVEEAVLKFDVAMHDAGVFMQVADCGCKLVSIAFGQWCVQTFSMFADEFEEIATSVESGDAEGSEAGVVDGNEGKNVPVVQASPETDFVFESRLKFIVFVLVFAGNYLPDDLDCPRRAITVVNSVRFSNNAEAAVADLLA
jgi:hypothetical protein